jgi:AbrB family looped-hinge helix DNA binding protein
MKTTIDKAGRVVIPREVRERLGLLPGTELEVRVEDQTVRLARRAPGPRLVRVKNRWVAKPTVPLDRLPPVDLAALVDEERDRWPGS